MEKDKKILDINDIKNILDDETVKNGAVIQKMVSKIVSLDLPNTDEALDDNGIIERENLIGWLKFKIQQNARQNYFGYLITESQELNYVASSSDTWFELDAYERVNQLSAPDIEALADDLGLLK